SNGCSQTRCVREAALAAHYVLRYRNRDVLATDQVSAAAAVAAIRGDQVFVALAGDAAAISWRDGEPGGRYGITRPTRPLGLEAEPRITLWSTPLRPGERLVLVCGAAWSTDSRRVIEEVLADTDRAEMAEARLAEALAGPRPAGVMVVDLARGGRPQ